MLNTMTKKNIDKSFYSIYNNNIFEYSLKCIKMIFTNKIVFPNPIIHY